MNEIKLPNTSLKALMEYLRDKPRQSDGSAEYSLTAAEREAIIDALRQTQQPEEDMPPNPPGIGGVNATYFIKRLDDARLAKRGVYEAKTLVFSWREAEVLKAILQRTEQADSEAYVAELEGVLREVCDWIRCRNCKRISPAEQVWSWQCMRCRA